MQLKKLEAVAGWKILHIIFSYNHIHIYLYEKILIITEFFIIQRNFSQDNLIEDSSNYQFGQINSGDYIRVTIIFEDDIRFEPFFKQRFKLIREQLDHMDWDLVYLGRKILPNYEEEDWVKG